MDTDTEQLFLLNSEQGQASSSSQKLVQIEIPDTTSVNLENVEDFSNVCRTCATITGLVIPIFAGEGLQNHLADKIHKHLPIKVSETDELPLVVCYQCVSTLLAWHELVKCCMQADQALKSRIGVITRTENTNKELEPTALTSSNNTEEDSQSKADGDPKNEAERATAGGAVVTLTVGPDGRRSAWCAACNKSVAGASWRRHARLHAGERRYSCHSCGRAFADSGNLARHVRALHQRQRPFACATCPKTFSRRAHLDDHARSHSEERQFVCDSCGKASKSRAALRMHLRTHAARALPCAQCGARFKRAGELRAHRSVHSGERAHTCACGRAFRLRSQLNAHARDHRSAEPAGFNNVNYCVAQSTKTQTARDPPRYTPPLLRCEFCNTMHPEVAFSKHLIDQHSELIFHCEDCNRYIHKREFMPHMSQHADNYMRDIEIKFKKKTKYDNVHQNINTSGATTRHQGTNGSVTRNSDTTAPVARDQNMNFTIPSTSNRSNNDIAPITRSRNVYPPKRSQNITTTRSQNTNPPAPDTVVTQCGKTMKHNQENEFSDHSDMEYGFGPLPESVFEAIEDTQDSQIEDTGQPADIEEFEDLTDDSMPANEENSIKQPKSKKIRTCPICSKVYKASSSYYYHLKHTHKRIKEHECEICAKKFATKASLASHTTTHTGECQFECRQCKKRFRSNASLYIHEQTHTGVKTWSCKQCQTAFRWKTHLLRHMKRHLAEKSHICSTCGRGFSIRCDLLRHTRTHTAGEFPCEKCDVKFAQMRYLKVHMAKKHSSKARRRSKSK